MYIRVAGIKMVIFYNILIHDYKKVEKFFQQSGNIRYWLTLITHLADTEQLLHNLDFNTPILLKSILNSSLPLYLHQKFLHLL